MTKIESSRRWNQAINGTCNPEQKRHFDAFDLEAERQGQAIRKAKEGRSMTCRGKKTRVA